MLAPQHYQKMLLHRMPSCIHLKATSASNFYRSPLAPSGCLLIEAMLEHLLDLDAWLPQHFLMQLLPADGYFCDAFCCLRHPGHQIPAGAVPADEQLPAGGFQACRTARLGLMGFSRLVYGPQLRTT